MLNKILRIISLLMLLRNIQGNVIKKTQCNSWPVFCPQNCLQTVGGCTQCACSGVSSMSNQMSSLGAYPASGTAGGLSISNPNTMLTYSNHAPAGLGPVPLAGSSVQFNSMVAGTGVGPGGNIFAQQGAMGVSGPVNNANNNPYVTGGAKDPSNPGNIINPGNIGSLIGSNNPALPYNNQLGGAQTIATQGTQMPYKSPSTSAPLNTRTTTLAQTTTKITTPAATTTRKASATFPNVSTTPKHSTPTTAMTSPATCPPLRCVAPCDKGIILSKTGCPVCLCA